MKSSLSGGSSPSVASYGSNISVKLGGNGKYGNSLKMGSFSPSVKLSALPVAPPSRTQSVDMAVSEDEEEKFVQQIESVHYSEKIGFDHSFKYKGEFNHGMHTGKFSRGHLDLSLPTTKEESSGPSPPPSVRTRPEDAEDTEDVWLDDNQLSSLSIEDLVLLSRLPY